MNSLSTSDTNPDNLLLLQSQETGCHPWPKGPQTLPEHKQ